MDVSATFQWWLWGFKGWFNDVAIWFLPDTCYHILVLILAIYFMFSDTLYLIHVIISLLSDTCYLILVIWYLLFDTINQIFTVRYLLSDTCIKYLIIDTSYLILSVWHWFYSLLSMWHLFNKTSHHLPKAIVYFTHVLCLVILSVCEETVPNFSHNQSTFQCKRFSAYWKMVFSYSICISEAALR